jgi:hypothetical protein
MSKQYFYRQYLRILAITLTCLLLASLSFGVYADQSQPTVTPPPPASNNPWIISFGIAPTIEPEYPGSNTTWLTYTALYNIVYNNRFFLSPQGLGVYLINKGPLI